MARRKKSSDEGVNLDSLMDALTNVVAVLILVLVLVQLDVTKKVSDYLDDLEPATPEQIEESKQELAKVEEDKKKIEEDLKKDPPTPEKIEEEKRRIALLSKEKKDQANVLADLADLQKLEKQVRKKRDDEKAETLALQDEIARLEATLDDTPVLAAIAATEVTIPSSRPIPDNAEIYHAIVKGDRIHFIDQFTPEKEFINMMKRKRRDLTHERIKQKGADRYILDQQKVMDLLKDHKFPNSRNQEVIIPGNPTSKRLFIQITPDFENGGTHIDQLAQPSNLFEKVLRKLSSNKKAVIFFEVHPDGFNTYLQARRLADKMRVPAGWQINGAPFYRHWVTEIEVTQLEDPPPPKPPTGKTPPKIGPKLD